jgi:hypothetical protein
MFSILTFFLGDSNSWKSKLAGSVHASPYRKAHQDLRAAGEGWSLKEIRCGYWEGRN